MFHAYARLDQRLFKGKRAAEHKANQILAPIAHDIGWFVNQCTALPNPITRQIAAKIEILPHARKCPLARF